LAEGLSCGGAYLKFLTADPTFTPIDLVDNTPYTVMFGPDKCGGTNKVHLIIRHKSPKTGEIEEKHLASPPSVIDDDLTHTYTAILYPSTNKYAVLIDGEEKASGSLFDDFKPPFNPAKEIEDPDDKKPEGWVDAKKIEDPAASKPDDWDEDAPKMIDDMDAEKPEGWLDDEPAEIEDPDATKPEDWDDEEDGDWEPPTIVNPVCADAPGCGEWKRPQKKNPEYKGKWTAPMVDNPEYKGEWKPRNIPNPDYYEDASPLSNIGAIGAVAVEIWTMDEGYFFDNVVVTNSPEEAEEIRKTFTEVVSEIEKAEAEEKKAKKEAEAAAAAVKDAKLEKMQAKAEELVGGLFNVLPEAVASNEYMLMLKAYLERNPFLLIGAMVAILLLPVALIITRKTLAAEKKKEAVGQAKKNDGDGDAAPKRAKSPTKKTAAVKKAEIVEEEESEEEEEEEEDGEGEGKTTTVRRRVRRD